MLLVVGWGSGLSGEAVVKGQQKPPIWSHAMERSVGMTYRLADPKKHPNNPILTPERSWEGSAVYLYGTVRRDPETDQFRMWYQTYGAEKPKGVQTLVCYATSNDGIHWTRPVLNQVNVQGSRANNVVLKPAGRDDLYSPSVFYDEEAQNPQKRYKLIYSDWSGFGKTGSMVRVAFSPDGIHWDRYEENPVSSVSFDALSVLPKKVDKKYVLLSKIGPKPYEDRGRGLSTSENFIQWDESEPVFTAQDVGTGGKEPYWMTASSTGDMGVGMVGVFDTERGTIRPTLTVSSDFYHWRLPTFSRSAIPLGEEGAFDHSMIYTQSNPFMEVGDEIWTYYGGFDRGHDDSTRTGAIGLARWQKDRFLGLHAGPFGGQVDSRRFTVQKSGLTVNAEIGSDGLVAAGLYDRNGEPIDGYEMRASDQIHQSGEQIPLSWKGNQDIGRLRGKGVTLRLYAENATIYSFQTADADTLRAFEGKSAPASVYETRFEAVFPNPATDQIQIHFRLGEKRSVQLHLRDALGRYVARIWEGKLDTGLYQFQHRLDGLASGTYFVTATLDKETTVTEKVIVVK